MLFCRPRQVDRPVYMIPGGSPHQFVQVDVPEVEVPQHFIVYTEWLLESMLDILHYFSINLLIGRNEWLIFTSRYIGCTSFLSILVRKNEIPAFCLISVMCSVVNFVPVVSLSRALSVRWASSLLHYDSLCSFRLAPRCNAGFFVSGFSQFKNYVIPSTRFIIWFVILSVQVSFLSFQTQLLPGNLRVKPGIFVKILN